MTQSELRGNRVLPLSLLSLSQRLGGVLSENEQEMGTGLSAVMLSDCGTWVLFYSLMCPITTQCQVFNSCKVRQQGSYVQAPLARRDLVPVCLDE